jgi:hypothetical protein
MKLLLERTTFGVFMIGLIALLVFLYGNVLVV